MECELCDGEYCAGRWYGEARLCDAPSGLADGGVTGSRKGEAAGALFEPYHSSVIFLSISSEQLALREMKRKRRRTFGEQLHAVCVTGRDGPWRCGTIRLEEGGRMRDNGWIGVK
jgi:hypothetical protein